MRSRTHRLAWKKRLVRQLTCPTCGHEFRPESVRYISRHPELLGDPVLGPNEYARFSPTHFAVEGQAQDGRGLPCADLACPRCHVQVPELLLEVPPLFISITGSPASGKSYFLTTMTYGLRTLMPRAGLKFTDAYPTSNAAIRAYEDTLFNNPSPGEPTEIRKTDPVDPALYKTAEIEGVATRLPLPLQFSIWPTREHPSYAQSHRIGRVLVMYDNAGEDFLPGSEEGSSEAVRHLARSEILFVLFDPTQETRLRDFCRADDPQVSGGFRPGAGPPVVSRQETILTEAAVRTRHYLGLPHNEPIPKPLVVVVPKFDVLVGVPGVSIATEPYTRSGGGSLRLRLEEVERTSAALREFLRAHCPDFVATAESLSERVRYVPVSSLGRSPARIERGGRAFYGIAPADVRPQWVTVPLIYCATKWARVVLGSADRNANQAGRSP